MSISIFYKKNSLKKNSSNLVLFLDEKFNISSLKKYISRSELLFISDLLKTSDLKEKILSFDFSSKKKVILISLKKNITNSDLENLGAKFYNLVKDFKINDFTINTDSILIKSKNVWDISCMD